MLTDDDDDSDEVVDVDDDDDDDDADECVSGVGLKYLNKENLEVSRRPPTARAGSVVAVVKKQRAYAMC